jgi:magnesium transporter
MLDAVSAPGRTVDLDDSSVVAATVYAYGKPLTEIPIDQAGSWIKKPGHVVWIGLLEPSMDVLRRLQAQFGLGVLAMTDASEPHPRPKLEQYGDALFIVARTAQLVDGRVSFGETHLFVGPGYVVSIRHGPSATYTPVRQRCEASPKALAHGEDYILFALLDFIVDNYMLVIEKIHEEVEAMEDRVFTCELNRSEIERLYLLRRDLLHLRNAALPLGEVCSRAQHVGDRPIESSMQPLFRDVTEHVHRVQEEIDSLREVLAFVFEASQMTGQMQQTHITRRLAAWAAILAVPTAVAGIYGMNFEFMPELHWQYGYLFVLGGVATICATLYWRLRASNWL